jgi:antitoxin (DNA-binding transcriptional repressor) of toxin-antitoxin stability system
MSTVGLRELRRGASDLVRRVEAAEEITITVSGRPSERFGDGTTDAMAVLG